MNNLFSFPLNSGLSQEDEEIKKEYLDNRMEDIVKPLFSGAIYMLMKEFFAGEKTKFEIISSELLELSRSMGRENGYTQETREMKQMAKEMKKKRGKKYIASMLEKINIREKKFSSEIRKISKDENDYIRILKEFSEKELNNSDDFDNRIKHLIECIYELFLFITKRSTVKEFSKEIKGKISSVVSPDNKEVKPAFDILKINTGINIIIDIFGELNEDKLGVILGMKKDIEILLLEKSAMEKEVKDIEKERRDFNQKIAEKTKSEERKDQVISNLNIDKIKLQSQIGLLQEENILLANENKGLQEIKAKMDSGIISGTDGKFFEEMCYDLEQQNVEQSKQIADLQVQVAKQYTEIMRLRSQNQSLKDGLDVNLDKITACRIKCESNFEECCPNDLVVFMTYSNASIALKEELAESIIGFLDFIIRVTTKGASSSTNVQSASEKGKGGGNYANMFLNPIINFIKQIYITKGTQVFLERMSSIEWKILIKEYLDKDLGIGTTKKQKVINIVHNKIENGKAPTPIFKAFEEMADMFENMEYGDIDLSVLAENIRSAVSSDIIARDIRNVTKKFIDTKK